MVRIPSAVIDDLAQEAAVSTVGTKWQLFTDTVMGGLSQGTIIREVLDGRPAIRMRGDVRLENNGGFIQMALDLTPDGAAIDAATWQGIEFDVLGNGQQYGVHLRTLDLTRPWQSYRKSFIAKPHWQTVKLSFEDFVAYRTETLLDLRRLRRLGIVAIGRAFTADLALSGVRFF
jgi:hypothetical protein